MSDGAGAARFGLTCFAMRVASEEPLVGFLPGEPAPGAEPRVCVRAATAAEVRAAFSGGPAWQRRLVSGDGATIELAGGEAGDVLLSRRHPDWRAPDLFHVAATGARVLCAPASRERFGWQRCLLDTVLGTASLCSGHEALHAGAVALPEGVVAVAGARPGAGKSTLCAELIRRGGRLFTDDLLFLTRGEAGVLAHAGPPLMMVPGAARGRAEALGTLMEPVSGELWMLARARAGTPARLRLVVVLERDSAHAGSELGPASPAALLGCALDSGSARRRRRFELLSDLAQETPVLSLHAGNRCPPEQLAELVTAAAAARVEA